MSKVLFSHSYFYKYDSKQWNMAEPYPPLMTITAAALLRSKGYHVDLFDVGLKDSPEELIAKLTEFKPDYFVVFDDGFNYLTKMCLTTMREAAFEMQKKAKDFGCKTITCSSDASDHFEKYLSNGADFVLKGEGEVTLLSLINDLVGGNSGKEVDGLFYLEKNKVKNTKPRPVNQQLDELPLAAWDLIDIEAYRQIWKSKKKTFYLNIDTTRGCPYKCNWCAKPIYGNRYNTRSPKLVVNEIEHHVKNHGVDHFWMCDDIFGLKPGWVQEFRDELQSRNLSIKYKIQSRADLLLQEDNIDALVASGLDEVWIGAESGSQSILDAMDKGTTIEQIEESTKLLKQKGVKVAFFIQFGYLGETRKQIDETIKMVLKLMPDKLGASVSYPLPGTKFYDIVKQDLQTKSNWTDSDDLDMMFKNTYPPSFYKKTHKYLHQRYRTKKGLLAIIQLLKKPWSVSIDKCKKVIALAYVIPLSILNNLTLKRLANKSNI